MLILQESDTTNSDESSTTNTIDKDNYLKAGTIFESNPNNLEMESYFNIINYRDVNNSTLACIPESFGYSDHEAFKIFPITKFPKCSKKQNERIQIIKIDHVTNQLVMDCPNGLG